MSSVYPTNCQAVKSEIRPRLTNNGERLRDNWLPLDKANEMSRYDNFPHDMFSINPIPSFVAFT
ncbi:hypothetical protein ACTXT7_009747 [Hymenolepis weldensis]